jgi:hypothetical protein
MHTPRITWLCADLFRMTGVKLSAEEAERAYPLRLLHKLTERGHEKLLRCADLYGTCALTRTFSYVVRLRA